MRYFFFTSKTLLILILLQKLQLSANDYLTLKWFSSYLTYRKQKKVCKLTYWPITCGVPQKSILGPLLFLNCIDDLPACRLYSVPRMFADDARITISSCDPARKQSKLNSNLVEIQTWLQANKLSLNVKKPSILLLVAITGWVI